MRGRLVVSCGIPGPGLLKLGWVHRALVGAASGAGFWLWQVWSGLREAAAEGASAGLAGPGDNQPLAVGRLLLQG